MAFRQTQQQHGNAYDYNNDEDTSDFEDFDENDLPDEMSYKPGEWQAPVSNAASSLNDRQQTNTRKATGQFGAFLSDPKSKAAMFSINVGQSQGIGTPQTPVLSAPSGPNLRVPAVADQVLTYKHDELPPSFRDEQPPSERNLEPQYFPQSFYNSAQSGRKPPQAAHAVRRKPRHEHIAKVSDKRAEPSVIDLLDAKDRELLNKSAHLLSQSKMFENKTETSIDGQAATKIDRIQLAQQNLLSKEAGHCLSKRLFVESEHTHLLSQEIDCL